MVICKQVDSSLYVSINDNLLIIDTKSQNDQILNLSAIKPAPTNQTKSDPVSENITSVDVSKTNHLLVATDNKQIFVFDPNLKLIKNFQTNRAVSKVRFTPQDDIIIADKTGDAYLYKLNSDTNENVLLLGHLSMLLDILITDCGNYIITSDRDEKIRVSHYPNAYNIQSYCLGHTEFVTNIELCDKVLISASGDGTVRFWDYIKGVQLQLIDTNEHVNNKNVKELFRKEMDSENVEINALPVTNMQVLIKSVIYIAVTLLNVNEIQLYSVDRNENLKISLIKNVVPQSDLISFSLSDKICALTTDGFVTFEINKDNGLKCFETVYQKYIHFFNNINKTTNVTTLYKRKFDNVQEYLERKKMRLELK